MKVIIIEDKVYKVTEVQFAEVKDKEKKLDEIEFGKYLNKKEKHYWFVGVINFQWRL